MPRRAFCVEDDTVPRDSSQQCCLRFSYYVQAYCPTYFARERVFRVARDHRADMLTHSETEELHAIDQIGCGKNKMCRAIELYYF